MARERDTAADFKLIQDALGMAPDEATAQAIGVLADVVRQDCVVMTRADLQAAMAGYAARALSLEYGEEIRPVRMPNGMIGYQRTGEPVTPLADPPAAH